MSLQTAFSVARSALFATSTQTSVVSRNIAGVNETGYARRLSLVETIGDGGVRAKGIARATDNALRNAALTANGVSAAHSSVANALDMVNQTIGDTSNARSPAALIGAFRTALTHASIAPQDSSAVTGAVNAAKTLAASLRDASAIVQNMRQNADASMTTAVDKINKLLGDFDAVNTAIVRGTQTGENISDALDRRDQILSDLSSQIGITAVSGKNGDTAIYTDSGATLFQDGARSVTMAATPSFAPGVSGAAVFVDGVAVTGATSAMPTQSGALAGLAKARDQDANTYQAQLDEIARGLIASSAQKDQSSSPTLPDRTGLFTWPGGPALPGVGAVGLAADIHIDASVDPSAGGDWTQLRDGGIGGAGAAYVYNQTGNAGFSARLQGLADQLTAQQTFDPSTQIATNTSVLDLATASAGWLGAQRKTASDNSAQAGAVASQASAALSNATGVNIDDQMSMMLNLEHSYQASAKMMSTVDSLYNALFSALG